MGATVFVQPLDLVKNRMQMSGEHLFVIFKFQIPGIVFLLFWLVHSTLLKSSYTELPYLENVLFKCC